jgi:hypothetical protein
MDKIPSLIHRLEETKNTDEFESLIDELSKFGETIIHRLLDEYLYTLPLIKGKRITVLRICQKIGYPENKTAIPYMVGIVSDINSPGWELAVQELIKIGSPAIPEIRDALRYYSNNYTENNTEYEGLCILLKEMGAPTVNPLVTDLYKLVEDGTESVKSYAREVIEINEGENSR